MMHKHIKQALKQALEGAAFTAAGIFLLHTEPPTSFWAVLAWVYYLVAVVNFSLCVGYIQLYLDRQD